jgi:hypothetical protein
MQKSLVANNRLSRRIWHRFLNVIDTRKHVESIWGIVKKKLRRSGPADDFRVPPPNLVYVGKRLP